MAVGEVLEHEDRFYILAGPAPPDARTLVLKHGEAFGVFNVFGDIDHQSNIAQGLFADGMRHLSRLEVKLEGQRMLVLSSKVTDDNTRIVVDLTNPDIRLNHKVVLQRGTLHLSRVLYLWGNTCFERLTLANFGLERVRVALSVTFDADFADIFEVRGTERDRRGTLLDPDINRNTVVLGYEGLDGVTRHSRIVCQPEPVSISESQIEYEAHLEPRARTSFEVTVHCEPANDAPTPSFSENAARLLEEVEHSRDQYCLIDSSSEPLTQWLRRSTADIRTLTTPTDDGLYPYAGIPWYSTPFGRDGIITALQLLWVNPGLAKGVLSYLAATQARETDADRDAEPGKILHERRTDEMANIGEVPFGQYYGSVDATPLFVVLAGAYLQATADHQFIESIWPNIELAMNWIDEYGDTDGDGFVEYQSKTHDGLANQGWKDSHDAVFHSNGRLAEPPIALCEVQGYVYDAKVNACRMAEALGKMQHAQELKAQAQQLKEKFNEVFWQDELGTFALALDGQKRLCRVRSSNAGHCLYSGIAEKVFARQVRDQLMSKSMFSGWGIRTIGSKEERYNPMSYHNGSIWPHDNAMIAAGFARYGFREAAERVFRGWFDASRYLELHRLPELCCGFARREGKGPTLYPVACSPQAWAAGAVFMMLGACLGLSVDGVKRQVQVHRPRIPKPVREIRLRGLRVGMAENGSEWGATLDLLFHRNQRDVGVLVLRKEGPVDVVVTK